MQHKLVIIAAGGTGSRLNANLPKQYMLLDNRPVLMHTIDAFKDIADQIIIAMHPKMISYWEQLCEQYQFNVSHQIVTAGKTRFQSVQNAINYLLKSVDKDIFNSSSIAVHDAARPLVDKSFIMEAFERAKNGICSTLAVKSTNSVRIGSLISSKSIDRDTVWQIQTPQTFPAPILSKAYEQPESPLFTDDCSVVEKLDFPIQLIESNNNNIKLTFPEDFAIAEFYLKDN